MKRCFTFIGVAIGALVSFLGIDRVDAITTTNPHEGLQNVDQSTPLVLYPSSDLTQQKNDISLNWHYSHTSHGSHTSHSSHYSSG